MMSPLDPIPRLSLSAPCLPGFSYITLVVLPPPSPIPSIPAHASLSCAISTTASHRCCPPLLLPSSCASHLTYLLPCTPHDANPPDALTYPFLFVSATNITAPSLSALSRLAHSMRVPLPSDAPILRHSPPFLYVPSLSQLVHPPRRLSLAQSAFTAGSSASSQSPARAPLALP
ncbi:hypothetical protein C8R44DRAFT_984727 [Mycena epipterygia]|nr:hypothetical protein C8R44DRAFT_984727 [Mycena epipterygia]